MIVSQPPNSNKKSPSDNIADWFSSASSAHPGGVNALMGDGAVKFIKDSIESLPIATNPKSPLGVWQKLATRNGGEVVDPGGY